MVVQELGFLVDLAVTASTEECYSEVLPHMAESSSCVLVHYSALGAECDLLPLVGVIRDGDPIQALGGRITATRGLALSLSRRDSSPDRCFIRPALVYKGSHPSLGLQSTRWPFCSRYGTQCSPMIEGSRDSSQCKDGR